MVIVIDEDWSDFEVVRGASDTATMTSARLYLLKLLVLIAHANQRCSVRPRSSGLRQLCWCEHIHITFSPGVMPRASDIGACQTITRQDIDQCIVVPSPMSNILI